MLPPRVITSYPCDPVPRGSSLAVVKDYAYCESSTSGAAKQTNLCLILSWMAKVAPMTEDIVHKKL